MDAVFVGSLSYPLPVSGTASVPVWSGACSHWHVLVCWLERSLPGPRAYKCGPTGASPFVGGKQVADPQACLILLSPPFTP